MTTFRIEPIHGSDCLAIMDGETRAAVIYPPVDGKVAIYPWFRSYPSLNFDGLPPPLKPEWDWHPSLDAVCRFLGIRQERAAA